MRNCRSPEIQNQPYNASDFALRLIQRLQIETLESLVFHHSAKRFARLSTVRANSKQMTPHGALHTSKKHSAILELPSCQDLLSVMLETSSRAVITMRTLSRARIEQMMLGYSSGDAVGPPWPLPAALIHDVLPANGGFLYGRA
jgi:hypothetical protein